MRHSYDSFYEDLASWLAKVPVKQAFVFVHGYNVLFEDAVYRTAQLAYDLGFEGAPIFQLAVSRAEIGYPVD